MSDPTTPLALDAATVPPRARASSYPPQFAARIAGREKRPLGDRFGLTAFGVNLTRLAPGAQSALLHRHTRQAATAPDGTWRFTRKDGTPY